MKTCLSGLDNLGWNGVHCVPSNTTNQASVSELANIDGQGSGGGAGSGNGDGGQGPTFGFYKGGDDGFRKLHLEGNDCFHRCEECLRMGIEGQGGGTVKCRWVPEEGASCWMGFEAGG